MAFAIIYLHFGHEIPFRIVSRDVFIIFVGFVMSSGIGERGVFSAEKGIFGKKRKKID